MSTPTKRNLLDLFLAGELIMRSVSKETGIPIGKLSALRTGAQVCDTQHADRLAKWCGLSRSDVLARFRRAVLARLASEDRRSARGEVETDRYGVRVARVAKRSASAKR